MAKITLSEGAEWIIERLPKSQFEKLKFDIEALVTFQIENYGYDKELKKSFNETKPVTLERK